MRAASGERRPATIAPGEPRPDDRSGRESWILRLAPLARGIARRYAGAPEQLDDLEQVALLGAVKAVSRFDPARGTPLATYAAPYIHGELRHHLRDNLGLPRVPRATQTRAFKVAQAANALSGRSGAPASAGEIALNTGIPRDEVVALLELNAAQRTRSLNAPSRAGEAVVDQLAGDDGWLEDLEYRHSLSRILGRLEQRERSVLFLRLGVGRTHGETARALGLSPGQAARLYRRALDKARAVAGGLAEPDREPEPQPSRTLRR